MCLKLAMDGSQREREGERKRSLVTRITTSQRMGSVPFVEPPVHGRCFGLPAGYASVSRLTKRRLHPYNAAVLLGRRSSTADIRA